MFGARPYLVKKFKTLTPDEAGDVLSYWKKSFGDRHPSPPR